MEMKRGRGQIKTERGLVNVGSRHGMAKVDRQTKPAEQGRCRQTQPADDPTGTGLEETTAADDPAGTGLAAKQQPAEDVGRPLAVQVGGGSAVVLATQKAGSDLPNRLHATYRLCLSPSIRTPLICKKPNLAPTFFLFFYIHFYFPTITRPLTPFTVLVRLTYRHLAYSQPLRSLPGGE